MINIRNKKATFQYAIIEKFCAGIQLTGTEIKSIRLGKVSINEAFCAFKSEALYVRQMTIAIYEYGNINNHEPTRERKLLLTKHELKRLSKKVREKGLTIIPLRLFINDRGLAKLDIGLAKGKQLQDKREDIRTRDAKRQLQRTLKNRR